MSGRMLWLADVARDAGLVVIEVDGWKTRGVAKMDPKGIINHHTGVRSTGDLPSLHSLVKGRPDLAGPLCHYGLGRSGSVYVVASGKANHAGDGQWQGAEFLDNSSEMVGIEAEHSGRSSDAWPEEQLDAYRLLDAAILRHVGQSTANLCGHKEWAQPPESTPNRKPDPIGIDMDDWRESVDEILRRFELGDVNIGDNVLVPGEQIGVNDPFANPFEWARTMGIFTENTNPDSVVTSEEFAVFLDRYHRKVVVPNLSGRG